MSAGPDLAEVLADGTDTVLLTQASTENEAQLIRERIAAAGGQDRPQVSLGPPGSQLAGLTEPLLERDENARGPESWKLAGKAALGGEQQRTGGVAGFTTAHL